MKDRADPMTAVAHIRGDLRKAVGAARGYEVHGTPTLGDRFYRLAAHIDRAARLYLIASIRPGPRYPRISAQSLNTEDIESIMQVLRRHDQRVFTEDTDGIDWLRNYSARAALSLYRLTLLAIFHVPSLLRPGRIVRSTIRRLLAMLPAAPTSEALLTALHNRDRNARSHLGGRPHRAEVQGSADQAMSAYVLPGAEGRDDEALY